MEKHSPSLPVSSSTEDRPAVDEWGIYDPSKAGLEALFERLQSRRQSADPDAKSVAAAMDDAARRLAEEQGTKK